MRLYIAPLDSGQVLMRLAPHFLALALLIAALALALSARPARATGYQQQVTQTGTPDGATLAYASTTVTAGSAATAAISGVAGWYACVTQVKVHLAQVTTAGDVALSDGTHTVHMECVDTSSFGAVCAESYSPPLQSSAPGAGWTATVPALSGGGAGDVFLDGYVRAGGC